MTIAKDHLGNMYSSLSEMARAYGINPATLFRRLDRGYSIKEALITDLLKEKKGIADHKGKKFNSRKEMALAYKITPATLRGRLQRGWSIERALTDPPVITQGKKTTDHKGNNFNSLKEMAEAYNITVLALQGRLRMGWNLEKALTAPIGKYKRH